MNSEVRAAPKRGLGPLFRSRFRSSRNVGSEKRRGMWDPAEGNPGGEERTRRRKIVAFLKKYAHRGASAMKKPDYLRLKRGSNF